MRKEKRKKRVLNLKTKIFKRSEFLGKYIVKILFRQNNKRFEEVEEKLDEIGRKRKASFSGSRTLREGTIIVYLDLYILI